MPAEIDSAAMLAACIILVILGGSAVLWILHLQRSNRNLALETNTPAWTIGWVNFGIFICTLVVSVFAAQLLAGQVLYAINSGGEPPSISSGPEAIPDNGAPSETPETELTPWMAVLAVLLLQLPLLASFYCLRRFAPGSFAGELNGVRLSIWQALAQAIPQFIRYLPIIWIVSFAWSGFLTVLQDLEIIEDFPPQELIKLFSQGGEPVAITLLVILAVIFAPIVEEIIFRGGIYRFLKSQTTLLPAQIISGAFFAVVHANLMSFLPLVVVGIFLARVYERSGSLLVPMCFHACFNGFSLLMLLIMSHSSIPIQ